MKKSQNCINIWILDNYLPYIVLEQGGKGRIWEKVRTSYLA